MQKFLKRTFDLLLASLAVVVLSPLLMAIAVFVKCSSEGPVIYRGVRTGLNGSDFYILKFRTMVNEAEKLGGPSTALNDIRLTHPGRILRKYKLDELPQLMNVLKGDMSLVGPRPQVKQYTDLYNREEMRMLCVRPGITDFASLYFSDMDSALGDGDVDAKYSEIIEPQKNKLRLRYVDEQSLLTDIRILIETAFSLIGIRNATRLNIGSFNGI